MPATRVIYTALLGGYERINEQPLAPESDVDFVCFTDDRDLESETWRIVHVDPLLPDDLVRSQRAFKLRGHPMLDDYEEHLYIDNSVTLKVLPEQILDDWLDGSDLTVVDHSYRERVIDEFDEVIALSYDEVGRVYEQLLSYSALYPEVLQEHPSWNAFSARRNTPQVRAALELWFDHVLRYSRRDQLSANVAFALSGVTPRRVELDNWESPLHVWPADVGRKTHMGRTRASDSGPLLAEIARRDRTIAELRDNISGLGDQLAASRADTAQLREVLDRIWASRSWRISRPLRALDRRRG